MTWALDCFKKTWNEGLMLRTFEINDAVYLIHFGGWRWKTFRSSSNMARISAKLCQHAFRTIPDVSFFDAPKIFSTKFLDRKFRFLLIWCGFWRATAEWASKSASSSNFALDRLTERSVRPKNLRFGEKSWICKKIFTRLKASVFLAELNRQLHVDMAARN